MDLEKVSTIRRIPYEIFYLNHSVPEKVSAKRMSDIERFLFTLRKS